MKKSNNISLTQCKCGEIWFMDIPEIEGSHVNNGFRPVLIISNNKGNFSSTEVTVIPMSSRLNKTNFPTHVLVKKDKQNCLKKDSILLCEHIMTLPQTRLINKIGEISNLQLLNKICKATILQIGIFSLNPSINIA